MKKCDKDDIGLKIKDSLEKIIFSLKNKKFNNSIDTLIFGYIIANIFNSNNEIELQNELIDNLYKEFQNSYTKPINIIYQNLVNKAISLNNLSLSKNENDSNDFCLFNDNEDNNIEKNFIDINSIDNINYGNKNQINININNSEKKEIKQEKKYINSIIGPEDYEDYEEMEKESKTECPICLEEYEFANPNNYYLDCGCIVHESCFDEYIETEITSGKVPIKCPLCKKIDVNELYIKDSLKKNQKEDLIQKFEKFSINYYILNHPKDTSCCPSVGCNYVFIYEKGDDYFQCPLCESEYCLQCKTDWHEGESCEQYRLKKDVNKLDSLFKEFVVGSNFKKCPYCNRWVEKNEGCNHISCLCGNHFCYNCGEKMNGQIFQHACYQRNNPGYNNWAMRRRNVEVKKDNSWKMSKKDRKRFKKKNK